MFRYDDSGSGQQGAGAGAAAEERKSSVRASLISALDDEEIDWD